MSVSNGQVANETTFNNAFASKTADNTILGVQTLSNTTQSTSKDTGALIMEGGLGVEKNVNAGGNVLAKGVFCNVAGSTGSPTLITAGGGITFGGYAHECQFIAGDGAPVDISANPQISAGTAVGQRITLIGCDDTNTVTFENGTGIRSNGTIVLVNGGMATWMWDGADWLLEKFNEMA